MPYEIVWENGDSGIRSRFSGRVTGEELQQHLQTLSSDPRFDSRRYHIIDCRDAKLEIRTLEQLAAKAGEVLKTVKLNPRVRVAFVAATDEAARFLKDWCSLTLAPYAPRVFETVSEARAWIDFWQRRTPHDVVRQPDLAVRRSPHTQISRQAAGKTGPRKITASTLGRTGLSVAPG